MSDRRQLRLVRGVAAPQTTRSPVDPWALQDKLIDGFEATQVARGFSPLTIDGSVSTLQRFLALTTKPVWDLCPADIDDIVAQLVERGIGAVTRRDYVSVFRQFFAYLEARPVRWSSAMKGVAS